MMDAWSSGFIVTSAALATVVVEVFAWLRRRS